MSQTVDSRPGRGGATVPASETARADRQGLLATAAAGDAWAVGRLCDLHGGALFSLARAVLGDSERAEAVVVKVIARACVTGGGVAVQPGRSLRCELGRLTYLYAIRCLADTSRSGGGSAITGLTELAHQQRMAVALVQCGDHLVGEVADLLDLSVTAAATLLCSGLRDLEASDRRAEDAGLRREGRR